MAGDAHFPTSKGSTAFLTEAIEYDGVWYPPMVLPHTFESLKTFEVREDDLILITYPKSGTHWMMELLTLIQQGGHLENMENLKSRLDPVINSEFIFRAPPDYKKSPRDLLDTRPSPRLYRTHLPSKHLPPQVWTKKPKRPLGKNGLKILKIMEDSNDNGPVDPDICMFTVDVKAMYPRISRELGLKDDICQFVDYGRVVYVTREPKDACASLHHFFNSNPANTSEIPWEELFEYFISEKAHFGNWCDHALGYWDHRNDSHVFFVTFEEMKQDIRSVARRLAFFMGKVVSEEDLNRILKYCTLVEMKKTYIKVEEEFENGKMYTRSFGLMPFLHKGVSGGWKALFSGEQKEKMDEMMKKRLVGTGLDVYYPYNA